MVLWVTWPQSIEFFLYQIKTIVYGSRPNILKALRKRITEEVERIREEVLVNVGQEFVTVFGSEQPFSKSSIIVVLYIILVFNFFNFSAMRTFGKGQYTR